MRPVNCYAFDDKTGTQVFAVSVTVPDDLDTNALLVVGDRIFRFESVDRARECPVYTVEGEPLLRNEKAPPKLEIAKLAESNIREPKP